MVKYKIEVSSSAERQLKKLPREYQIRVLKSISFLAEDPRPQNCRKLSGYDNVYRIRVGNYRIIYEIDNKRIIVIILKLGHRKDVCR